MSDPANLFLSILLVVSLVITWFVQFRILFSRQFEMRHQVSEAQERLHAIQSKIAAVDKEACHLLPAKYLVKWAGPDGSDWEDIIGVEDLPYNWQDKYTSVVPLYEGIALLPKGYIRGSQASR